MCRETSRYAFLARQLLHHKKHKNNTCDIKIVEWLYKSEKIKQIDDLNLNLMIFLKPVAIR